MRVLGIDVFQNTPNFMLRGFFESQIDCPAHQQMFTEIVFVLGGTASHYTEPDGRGPISRGDVWIIPDAGIHGYYETKDLRIFNLLFMANRLPLPLLELHVHPAFKHMFVHNGDHYRKEKKSYPHLRLDEETLVKFEMLLHRFTEIDTANSLGRNCGKLGLLMTVLSLLCDVGAHTAEQVEMPLDLSRVMNYLSEHYNKSIHLGELARLASVSKNTLLRHFRKMTGSSPLKYLQEMRLHAAASLLRDSTLTLDEIAELIGFNSRTYLSSCFHRLYGVSPIAYRTDHIFRNDAKTVKKIREQFPICRSRSKNKPERQENFRPISLYPRKN